MRLSITDTKVDELVDVNKIKDQFIHMIIGEIWCPHTSVSGKILIIIMSEHKSRQSEDESKLQNMDYDYVRTQVKMA